MDNSVFFSLISDCLLALVLFALFSYVAHVSRTLYGIATWGLAHLAYTLGADSIDVLASALHQAGHPLVAMLAINLGAMLACAGMAGLAWALVQFIQQRRLHRWELAWMPLSLVPPAIAWLAAGTTDAQGLALSLVEVVALLTMIWQLRRLRGSLDKVPARLMMVTCALLICIYSSGMSAWFEGQGHYNIDDIWVSADLALWFMLNFCMLMLSSFHAAEALRRGALVDPLTGALNRRGLSDSLDERRTPGAAAAPYGLSVLALDLDRFKQINDSHGHRVGDQVLQAFSDTVRACIRQHDLFARTGGEEFVVITAGMSCEEVIRLGERIRQSTGALRLLPHLGLRVSVSVGVACATRSIAVEDLMDLADQALYEAKRGGRNCVVHLHEAP
ncbi:GGDEF domain-containing protein [Pseudoxanthomonas winnipegensis]|uniref:GGDEF domain-containing protein n=1 Tax=Pseudoxanthomonas winnipegensis TaxID=2480810 RepID=UPI0010409098|nr:GGDEF domain-containing protein [Pseudoxanthomonas winnipegensis]TBV75498.1 GGDEF domain-containing protein [Pseudoxanthomonas winnipegensis]